MFEISLGELMMIGIVALVVIGPEKLPPFARAIGTWSARIRGFIATMKADLDRDLPVSEVTQLGTQIRRDLKDIVSEARILVDEKIDLGDQPKHLAKLSRTDSVSFSQTDQDYQPDLFSETNNIKTKQ